MLDISVNVPVSAELHSILQIDVRIVRNLCKAGLTSLVISFLDDTQLFSKMIIFFVDGIKGNAFSAIQENIIFRVSSVSVLQIGFFYLVK